LFPPVGVQANRSIPVWRAELLPPDTPEPRGRQGRAAVVNTDYIPHVVKPGETYGSLTVIRFVGSVACKRRYLCACACGTEKTLCGSTLKSGAQISCGCSRLKYGRRVQREAEYRIWRAVRQRCENPKHSEYPNYGGRGISFAPEWRDSYATFLRDMGRRPSHRHSIERIDNAKGYGPGNCRWATQAEQNRNMRTNRRLTFRNETLCLKDWAIKLGAHSCTLSNRLAAGWSVERVLGEPIRPRRRKSR
jgi:hypothetical protein